MASKCMSLCLDPVVDTPLVFELALTSGKQ